MGYILDSAGSTILDSSGEPIWDSAGEPAGGAFHDQFIVGPATAAVDVIPDFYVALEDPDIGTLELTCDNGYTVTNYDLGVPSAREQVVPRTNAHGMVDQTVYLGDRTVSLSVTLDGEKRPCAQLRDDLVAYMNASLRPVLHIVEPRDGRRRRVNLRALTGGIPVAHPTVNDTTLTWKAPDGIIESYQPTVLQLKPGGGDELGRTYLLTFPRDYPSTAPPRNTERFTNPGRTWSNWVLEIYGECTKPFITLNGETLYFDQGLGVSLTAGQLLVVTSQGRRAMYDNDPTTSALQYLNRATSTWFQVPPNRESTIRFDAATYNTASCHAVFRFYPSWI